MKNPGVVGVGKKGVGGRYKQKISTGKRNRRKRPQMAHGRAVTQAHQNREKSLEKERPGGGGPGLFQGAWNAAPGTAHWGPRTTREQRKNRLKARVGPGTGGPKKKS